MMNRAREQLFSRARLAKQENGRGRLRDFLNLLRDGSDRFRLAYDLRKAMPRLLVGLEQEVLVP